MKDNFKTHELAVLLCIFKNRLHRHSFVYESEILDSQDIKICNYGDATLAVRLAIQSLLHRGYITEEIPGDFEVAKYFLTEKAETLFIDEPDTLLALDYAQ